MDDVFTCPCNKISALVYIMNRFLGLTFLNKSMPIAMASIILQYILQYFTHKMLAKTNAMLSENWKGRNVKRGIFPLEYVHLYEILPSRQH